MKQSLANLQSSRNLAFVVYLVSLPGIAFAQSRSGLDAIAVTVLGSSFMAVVLVLIFRTSRTPRDLAEEADTDAIKAGVNPLSIASANGDIEKVAQLVSSGASVNEQDAKGATALMYAARNDRVQVIEFLIDHGAVTDILSATGSSALSIAQAKGSKKAIEMLKEAESKK